MYDLAFESELDAAYMEHANYGSRKYQLRTRIIAEGSLIINPTINFSDTEINGLTFAAFIVDFIWKREIMKPADMKGTPFFELLSVLENDLQKRGLENVSLSDIFNSNKFEQTEMEEIEEIFQPIWAMYPYRDAGFIRRLGLKSEQFSFCQWSMEWSINSSAVTCEIARCNCINSNN